MQIASLLNAVQIMVLNAIYQTIATKINEWENHRTDTMFEDNLIGKTFIFKFSNSFGSMFYIAFIKNLIGDTCKQDGNGHPACMRELSSALSIIFLVQIFIGNFKEVVIPYLMGLKKAKDETPASKSEEQFVLGQYDDRGLFLDYDEMILQFGYASLFVTAFPLAPFLAAVNNHIEIRVDAFKLLEQTRRPIPKGAEDIGTWMAIIEIMGVASVITNSLIMVFTAKYSTGGWQTWEKLLGFIFIEHTVLFIKFLVGIFIPDSSEATATQLDRAQYLVDKVVNKIPDDDDTFEAPSHSGDEEVDFLVYRRELSIAASLDSEEKLDEDSITANPLSATTPAASGTLAGTPSLNAL
jgi:anoctamin-10/anoctamin-7